MLHGQSQMFLITLQSKIGELFMTLNFKISELNFSVMLHAKISKLNGIVF